MQFVILWRHRFTTRSHDNSIVGVMAAVALRWHANLQCFSSGLGRLPLLLRRRFNESRRVRMVKVCMGPDGLPRQSRTDHGSCIRLPLTDSLGNGKCEKLATSVHACRHVGQHRGFILHRQCLYLALNNAQTMCKTVISFHIWHLVDIAYSTT